MSEETAMNSPRSKVERPLTSRQLVKIWAAAREIGLGDQALHRAVEQVCGKQSIRVLTKSEAKLVIDFLVDGLGASGPGSSWVPSRPSAEARPGAQLALSPTQAPVPVLDPTLPRGPAMPPRQEPRERPGPAKVITLATHGQLALIDHLLQQLGLSWESPRFLGVLGRATGRSRIRTTADALRVIEALKAIAERPQGHAGFGQVEPPKGA